LSVNKSKALVGGKAPKVARRPARDNSSARLFPFRRWRWRNIRHARDIRDFPGFSCIRLPLLGFWIRPCGFLRILESSPSQLLGGGGGGGMLGMFGTLPVLSPRDGGGCGGGSGGCGLASRL